MYSTLKASDNAVERRPDKATGKNYAKRFFKRETNATRGTIIKDEHFNDWLGNWRNMETQAGVDRGPIDDDTYMDRVLSGFVATRDLSTPARFTDLTDIDTYDTATDSGEYLYMNPTTQKVEYRRTPRRGQAPFAVTRHICVIYPFRDYTGRGAFQADRDWISRFNSRPKYMYFTHHWVDFWEIKIWDLSRSGIDNRNNNPPRIFQISRAALEAGEEFVISSTNGSNRWTRLYIADATFIPHLSKTQEQVGVGPRLWIDQNNRSSPYIGNISSTTYNA